MNNSLRAGTSSGFFGAALAWVLMCALFLPVHGTSALAADQAPAAEASAVDMGGVTVLVPAPAGFKEDTVSGPSEAWVVHRSFLRNYTESLSTLPAEIAMFCEDPETVGKDFGPEDFAKFTADLRAKLNSVIKALRTKSVVEPAGLDVEIIGDTELVFIFESTTPSTAPGELNKRFIECYMVVKGRLCRVAIGSMAADLQFPDDLVDLLLDWVDAIRTANDEPSAF